MVSGYQRLMLHVVLVQDALVVEDSAVLVQDALVAEDSAVLVRDVQVVEDSAVLVRDVQGANSKSMHCDNKTIHGVLLLRE